jgi:hypothetical protein
MKLSPVHAFPAAERSDESPESKFFVNDVVEALTGLRGYIYKWQQQSNDYSTRHEIFQYLRVRSYPKGSAPSPRQPPNPSAAELRASSEPRATSHFLEFRFHLGGSRGKDPTPIIFSKLPTP